MTRLLGEKYINGTRLTDGRPQGTISDQEFVVGSFGSGLSPKNFLVMQGQEERHFVTLH